MTRLAMLLATAGGAGYAPVAPGTVGSAVGILLYFVTRSWSSLAQGLLLLAIIGLGTWAGDRLARRLAQDDPGCVVIDEVAGQLLTVFLLDVGVVGAALGFLLFRVLDIVKPWPARRMETLHGGLGIMADDLMAGVYGWVVLAGTLYYVPALR
jgi:phosphatidylglycerophosphatase A